MLTNDIAELSGGVNLTSVDIILDMDGRDCSFKALLHYALFHWRFLFFLERITQEKREKITQRDSNARIFFYITLCVG